MAVAFTVNGPWRTGTYGIVDDPEEAIVISIQKRFATGAVALAIGAFPAAATAQQPGPQDILRQMQQGVMPGVPGMSPLAVQQGTWVYPVAAGLHTGMADNRNVESGGGIDANFIARASVYAAYVQAGEPPTCAGGSHHDMRGRTRIVAMTVDTGTGPFMAGGQLSRLVVNQAEQRAVLYLYGNMRSWVPGPNHCDDQQMVEETGGRGFLRMEYSTTAHVAPLNFMAFPRAGEVDVSDLEDACNRFKATALEAYQDMNRRWNLITNVYNGPVDWSVITPVEEGYADAERTSFANGLFNSGDVIDAASAAADAVSLGASLANAFSRAPRVAESGAAGIAQWVVMQAMEPALNAAGIETINPVDAMMMMATMGHAAFRDSDEPRAREIANHAMQRFPEAGGPFEGIDADYMLHTLMQACEGLNPQNMPEGSATGHFSWPGGTVILSGRGLAPGEPAAIATGPVQSGSIADALAMAQAMGANIPDKAQIQAAMPPGMSLDAMPAPMTGRAGGGAMLASNTPEWTVSFTVELVDDGERIADLWFDPRR